jgi:hypothetical protein
VIKITRKAKSRKNIVGTITNSNAKETITTIKQRGNKDRWHQYIYSQIPK